MARWLALWLNPALTPEIEREVNIERLVTTPRHQPLAALAHSINSAVLIFTAWPYFNHWALTFVRGVISGCGAAPIL
jgi:hypothetical protein